MANEGTVDQQQLQSTINELYARLSEIFPAQRDALRNALNTIQVGENQTLGMLAAADDLASAPIGDPAALRDRLNLEAVLGALASLNTLSEAEVGDAAALRKNMGLGVAATGDAPAVRSAIAFDPSVLSLLNKFGLGALTGSQKYPNTSLTGPLDNVASGSYTLSSSNTGFPAGASAGGIVTLEKLNATDGVLTFYERSSSLVNGGGRVYTNYCFNGVWNGWRRLNDNVSDPEIGVNSNGIYARFSSGLLLCAGTINITGYDNSSRISSDWYYPAEFFESCRVFAVGPWGSQSFAVNRAEVRAAQGSLTSSRVAIWSNAGDSFSSGDRLNGVDCFAIGRWKA